MEDNTYLKHYGIPGMRWGRRKGRVATSTTSKSKSNGSTKKRRISNKELNARLKRLRLEQEYERLSTVPKKSTVDKIENTVKLIGTVATLTTAATTIYKNLSLLKKVVPAGK